jgi:demethylmenaquinone methyltransferase/2-methoxy-6-polyprenyl-1,4-benzoquinol methylase
LGWFQQLSLDSPEVHTFAGTVHAPLDESQREALLSLIEMRWPGVQAALSDEDWKLFQRLTHPESDEFILNIPDYYAFFTYSLFSARIPE